MIWVIWMTYGAFYFCRNNLALALPGIEREFKFDKETMGGVLMALKIAYGAGQLINGQLAERLSPRKMLAIGMFASAGLNVVFGFGTALFFFIFVWAMNGYSQSLGWTPCVRVIGNWVPVGRRGWAVGIIGTGYMLTAALTYVVAGAAVELFGWRGALFVPPFILITAGVVMLLFLKEEPEEAQLGPEDRVAKDIEKRTGLLENLRLTASNPALWVLGISLGMLNACRYGYLDWGVSHLVDIEKGRVIKRQIDEALPALGRTEADALEELKDLEDEDLVTRESKRRVAEAIEAGLFAPVQRKQIQQALRTGAELDGPDRDSLRQLVNADLASRTTQQRIDKLVSDGVMPGIGRTDTDNILKSAIKYAVLPFGAIFGSFLAGWATDLFFRSRRAPVICLLLVLLGVMTLFYDQVARGSFIGVVVLLMLVGFCIYGPQVLLVGTAPADLAKRGTSAAAAGFVNSLGYVGAAVLGNWLTGLLIDHYGWNVAIQALAGWAFGAAILTAVLWNVTATAETGNEPVEAGA